MIPLDYEPFKVRCAFVVGQLRLVDEKERAFVVSVKLDGFEDTTGACKTQDLSHIISCIGS